jgi:hypothetical protein
MDQDTGNRSGAREKTKEEKAAKEEKGSNHK